MPESCNYAGWPVSSRRIRMFWFEKNKLTTSTEGRKSQLRQRVLHAGGWSVGGQIASQLIRLASNLVMTRLLVPEMFGVMAIVMVVQIGLQLFSDVGLKQSIIRSGRVDDPVFLNSVWSVQIVRGVLLWLIALLIALAFYLAGNAGWLAPGTVYANPILPYVIGISSFSAVVMGFESTSLALAARALTLKKIVAIDVVSQIFAVCFMIGWALLDPTIWALVAGGMVGVLVKVVLSHRLPAKQKNAWCWDKPTINEIFQFGKWVFVSSILGFALNNGDRLLLGGMIGADELGFYSIAFMMVNVVQTLVGKLNTSVTFPAISEIYRRKEADIKRGYYKFRLYLDFFVLSMAGFLWSAGETIIDILYDPRYIQSGGMLQILSLVLVAQRYGLADQCFLAMGKPKLLTVAIVVKLTALYLFVPVGFYLQGTSGAIWGVVMASLVGIPVSLYMKHRHSLLDIRKELVVLPVYALGALIGFMFVQAMQVLKPFIANYL